MEADAVAGKMASLRAADWPRAQVSELEVDWSRVTSALSKLQEQLQRRLLDEWPPVKLVPGLQVWFQELETRLSREKETVSKAESAAQMTDVLQNYQVFSVIPDLSQNLRPTTCSSVEHQRQSCPSLLSGFVVALFCCVLDIKAVFQGLKGAMTNAQTLLEFLCQTGPQLVPEDTETISDRKTLFAEQMGELRRQCELLLTDVRTQVCSSAFNETEPSFNTSIGPRILPRLWFCPRRSMTLSRCTENARRERRDYSTSVVGWRSRSTG